MTSAPEIHAEFRGVLGKFALEAVLAVQASPPALL
jgi:hypothetical protein